MCMQEHLFRHFLSSGHNGFLNDASITFIDKTDPSDTLKREDYWRRTLKTMAPFRLNSLIINIFWHLDHAIVLDCFKDYDFRIMDISIDYFYCYYTACNEDFSA